MAEKFENNSMKVGKIGIGQNADGTFNSFPLSELEERTAARKQQEEATEYAAKQLQEGFPPEDDDEPESDEDDEDTEKDL
jgi:hypothetical protein